MENILKEIKDFKCNKCIYENDVYEFTGENEITIKGEKIVLDKELADWGARAYRMSLEANINIDFNKFKNILK